MTRVLHGRPITVRITAGFLCAMAVLLLATGAFIYERMDEALDRSIHDVPSDNRAEIDARRRHRNEALHELLGQLAVAFSGTLLISGLVGYRVARAALDPVERMRHRASTESVDRSFRLPVPDSDDELSRLAETLNDLLARVQDGVAREHRFVADASHELRTPLGRLLLELDLALSRERTPEELNAALKRLRGDAHDLVRLADHLLLLARADDGRLPLTTAPVDVRAALSDAAARFGERARSQDRALTLDVAEDTRVVADRERLAQVLDNLVDNALTHGDGTIELGATRSDDRVRLHVIDEGRGFPQHFLARAFDRFSTAAPARSNGGTGLGLAIVAAIATAHGATVGAGNRPAGGADVWIELPAADGGQRRGRALTDTLATSTPATPTRSTKPLS